MLPPAIVLGIDSPIGLTVLRELGGHGVPVHAIGRSATALGRYSRYCSSFSQRPAGRPLAGWLPEVIAQTGAAALLAISESDLIELAELPETIAGCRILTPRGAKLDLVLDKQRTLQAAAALGFDLPTSWQPLHGEDFAAISAGLEYPVVLKWADASAALPLLEAQGIAFEKAEFSLNPAELSAVLTRYAPLQIWPLVQSYCPGKGLGQMLFMSDGKAVLRFQHRRLHEWPPEGGVSTLCKSEPLERHAAQMVLSEALLEELGWNGPAMVEYRFDPETGRYWLMEINGRFWGSQPLAWHCGVHFAWEAYRRSVLGQTDQIAAAPIRSLRARYMIPETRRLLRLLTSRRSIKDPQFQPRRWRDLARFLLGFLDPRMRYYVFSWRDPLPFVSDLGQVIGKALRSR
jgi:predicted ATP-grasp superfamily ATP-dependent carboligase